MIPDRLSLIPTLFVWRLKIHSGPLLAIVRTQEEGISRPETTMHCFSESVWINAKYYQLPATSCFHAVSQRFIKFCYNFDSRAGRQTILFLVPFGGFPFYIQQLQFSGNFKTCFFWQNGTGTMIMTILGRRRALEDLWEDRLAVLLCKGPKYRRITKNLKVCEFQSFLVQKSWCHQIAKNRAMTNKSGLPPLPPGDRYYGQEAAEVSTNLSTERALCHASALHDPYHAVSEVIISSILFLSISMLEILLSHHFIQRLMFM